MAEPLRTFIAVAVPPQAREALGEVQARWRATAPPGVRWVDPQGVHLTLKFLGNVSAPQVEAISGAMERAARPVPPFTLRLGGPGAFPSARRPRVLWVSVEGDTSPLRVLSQRLEAELLALGFPKETRPFSPHLTLGRARNPQGPAPLPQDPIPPVHWEVAHVDLMQSTLLPGGACYTLLARAPLAGESPTTTTSPLSPPPA